MTFPFKSSLGISTLAVMILPGMLLPTRWTAARRRLRAFSSYCSSPPISSFCKRVKISLARSFSISAVKRAKASSRERPATSSSLESNSFLWLSRRALISFTSSILERTLSTWESISIWRWSKSSSFLLRRFSFCSSFSSSILQVFLVSRSSSVAFVSAFSMIFSAFSSASRAVFLISSSSDDFWESACQYRAT